MLVEMKLRSDGEGRGVIELTLPAENLMESAALSRRPDTSTRRERNGSVRRTFFPTEAPPWP